MKAMSWLVLLAASSVVGERPAIAQSGLSTWRAEELYRVHVRGAYFGDTVDEAVAFSAVVAKSRTAPALFWYAELQRRDDTWCGARGETGHCAHKVIDVHAWIDGRACPKLKQVLSSFGALPAQKLVDAADTKRSIIQDIPLTTVSGAADAEGVGASVSMSAYTGPLVDWWAKNKALLKTCWRDDPVVLDGSPALRRLQPTEDPQFMVR